MAQVRAAARRASPRRPFAKKMCIGSAPAMTSRVGCASSVWRPGAQYEAMPMPGLQDEEWRRTDYRHIRWEEAGRLQ